MSRNYHISQVGLDLIKAFEGCRLRAYQDVVGVWTIGWGWTNPVDGVPVGPGMMISQEKADALLATGVQPYANAVNAKLEIDINQNQFDALTSFVYNLGPGVLVGNFLNAVNSGNAIEVSRQMQLYNQAGGVVYPGLVRRRYAEGKLYTTAYSGPAEEAKQIIEEEDDDVMEFVIVYNGAMFHVVAGRMVLISSAEQWAVLDATYHQIKGKTIPSVNWTGNAATFDLFARLCKYGEAEQANELITKGIEEIKTQLGYDK